MKKQSSVPAALSWDNISYGLAKDNIGDVWLDLQKDINTYLSIHTIDGTLNIALMHVRGKGIHFEISARSYLFEENPSFLIKERDIYKGFLLQEPWDPPIKDRIEDEELNAPDDDQVPLDENADEEEEEF